MTDCCGDAVGGRTRRAGGFGGWVVRKRKAVFWITALAVLASGWGATRLRLNVDFVSYLSAANPLVEEYRRVAEAFGGNEYGVVLVEADNVYRGNVLVLLASLTELYEAMDEVAYVTSLTNTLEFEGTEWGIDVGRLVDPDRLRATDEVMADLRARVRTNARIVGNLVSDDGTLSAIQVRLRAEPDDPGRALHVQARRVAQATEEYLRNTSGHPEVRVQFGGLPFIMYNVSEQIKRNMAVLLPLMLGFLTLVLYFGLRHWAGVVFPLTVVSVSSAAVVGIMGFLGLPLDLLAGLIPVVLIVLGSADGIHFMKRYLERIERGDPPQAAAAWTFEDIRVPLALTTLTTVAGFGSLAISDVVIIRQFGLLTSLGLVLALVATLVLLPALTSFGIRPPRRRAGRGASWFASTLTRIVSSSPRGILTGALVITLVGAGGTLFIVRSVDWTLCLEKNSPPQRAEMLLRQKMGGSLPVQVHVEGDILDPATLRILRTAERHADALPTVSKTQSLAGLLAEMNLAVNGRFSVPDTREGVGNLWFLIEGEDAVEQLVAPGAVRDALVQGRVVDWETPSIRGAVRGVEAWGGLGSARWAVVDLRRIPEPLWHAVRTEATVELLLQMTLDMQAHGVQPPSELERIAATFTAWVPDQETTSAVEEAVVEYLGSDESEVLFSGSAARALASPLARTVGRWGGNLESIQDLLNRIAPPADASDLEALALSLHRITYETVGLRRVEAAWASLQGVLPPSAEAHETLGRNLRGALWEAHSPTFVMTEPVFVQLSLPREALDRWVPLVVRRSGLASVLEQMERELLPTQVQSLALTIGLVVLLLTLLFGSPVAGGVMVLPLAAAVVMNFGAIGYARLGLDSFTAMVAAIAIGLGVDYAIHFTHRLRRELRASRGNLEQALERAFETSGIAIAVNTIAVGGGFLVLLAASCTHMRRFGGLSSLAMIVAGAATLILLPTVYLQMRPRFLGPLASDRVPDPEDSKR